MQIIPFGTMCEEKMVVALGFFDCIHKGHGALIERAVSLASEHGAKSAVFTFINDPNTLCGKPPQIYNFEERSIAIERLGAERIIFANFCEQFMQTSARVFLDAMTGSLNIAAFVIGSDYTFGKDAEGDRKLLEEYAVQKGIAVELVPYVMSDGKKTATRTLKTYLAQGDIERLNDCLTMPYFKRGFVVHGHHRGTALGFPTANIAAGYDTVRPANGIYATVTEIDGARYTSMTNVGVRPTFDGESVSIETHIFDFSGDIYNREITVSFYKRMRDEIKFQNAQALKEQLSADEREIRAFFEQKKEI